MTVLVIGASARAVDQLRQIAPRGLDIVNEPVAEADWILVATTSQRADAVRSHALAPFRVVELPEIASELDPAAMHAVRTALVKIAGIGGPRPLVSPMGLALVRLFVRRRSPSGAVLAHASVFDDPEATLTRRLVPRPMPSGTHLDELLRERARKRAERFIAQAQRWPAGKRNP
jgi:hypothetical protein